MKWLGYRQMAVKDIVMDGSVRRRMKEPRVLELAADTTELGDELINAPAVRKSDSTLRAGRDRMASVLVRKASKVWVHLFEGTDQEAKDVEDSENLWRRSLSAEERDALIARRVRTVAGGLLVEKTGNAGRPKSVATAAREKVARELGTTPEAIRSAEKRAAEDEAGDPTESIEQAAELAPPVDTWDVPVDHLAQEFAQVRIAQAAIDETDRHLRAAQRALSALRPEHSDLGSVTSAVYSRIYHQLHQVADEVRRSRPDVLCVYCKGLAHRRGTCGGCLNLGYMSKDGLEYVAPELLKRGDEAVVVNGRGGFETLAQARTPKPKAEAKGKKLKIEDEEGNDLAFREGEDLF